MPAKSVKKQRLFGAVLNCKRTGKCSSKQVKKVAKHISEKDAEDFARTKHKGLPTFKEFVNWMESQVK